METNSHLPTRKRNYERDERIKIIHRLVYDATYHGKKVMGTDLAEACGVDARTIYEDRMFMDRHDMTMKFDRQANTWKYTKAVDYNPKCLMSEGLFFTLMIAEKALRECHSLRKRRMLLKIFRQIAGEYKDLITFDLDGMDDRLTVSTMLQPKFDPARVEYLLNCAAKNLELEVLYETPKKKKGWRKIKPLHVHKADKNWILFCHDEQRGQVIRLLLGRMEEIKETGQTFVRPADFDIEKELKGALIIFTGDELVDVTCRFTAEVSHFIHENHVRCETARRQLPDGSLELDLKLGSLVEIPHLIGGYGANAYPLQPPELVQAYINTARAMLKAVGAE